MNRRDFRIQGISINSPLLQIARRYAWSLPIVAVLSMATSVLEGLGVGLLIPLLGVFAPETIPLDVPAILQFLTRIPSWFAEDVRLWAIAGLLLGVIVLRCIIDYANASLVDWVDGVIGHELRAAIADRLLTYGYPFFVKEDAMRLVNIVSQDSWRAAEAVQAIFSLVIAASAAAVFSIILIIVEWRLFLVIVAGELVIRYLNGIIAARLERMSALVSRTNQALGEAMILLTIDLFKLVRIFGAEDRERRRFVKASDDSRRIGFEVGLVTATIGPLFEILQAILFIGVLLGAHAFGMNIVVLATFLVLMRRLQPYIQTIGEVRSNVASVRTSVREVEWLLDPAGKAPAPSGSLPFRHLERDIVFEKVTYQYPGQEADDRALTDASFAIRAGVATAIIGRSGSGKSTVVSMLCRLLQPAAGRITVDGVDLNEIEPRSWLGRIGLAGQDIDLMDGTVAENIAYGAEGVGTADIEEAARLADADGFIRDLPQGFDTPVTSRGTSLSGGQRQRIGIARALVRKPDILILDEATNAVDIISEDAVMSLLAARAGALTTIIISHRQSTLAKCAEVVVLEDGRVRMTGALPADDPDWMRAFFRSETDEEEAPAAP